MKRPIGWLAIGLMLAIAVAACGEDDASGTTSAARGRAATREDAAPAATIPPPSEPGGDPSDRSPGNEGQAVITTLTAVDIGRSVVFTANLSVEVDDVVAAGEQAQAAVAGLGGLLFGQETRTGSDAQSVLTIRVPPENFREAMQRLVGLGKLKSQSVFSDDVTDRVVDLQSQITTAEASVVRLRGFLADTADLKDLAVLEAELLRRETDLEVLRGRLRTVEGQVALATIVLVLTEPTALTPQPAVDLFQTAYAGQDGGLGCPGNERLTIDEDEPMTVCYSLTNTGDTALGEKSVTPVLTPRSRT